ncbi:hypothetical protein GCM10009616_28660 [Microlunatus lacustris]
MQLAASQTTADAERAEDAMRLIASSDPTAVPRAEAMRLIDERLVLATAVCAELDACGGNYTDDLPAAALRLLRRWVGNRYPGDGIETSPKDGLDEMIVPKEGEDKMAELRIASGVCEALAWLWTADTPTEFKDDSDKLAEVLQAWREARLYPPLRWGRPVPGAPAISVPALGRHLSPDISSSKKVRAEKQAKFWNLGLAEDPVFGPGSGYVVGVTDQAVDGRWPLVWTRPPKGDVSPSGQEGTT